MTFLKTYLFPFMHVFIVLELLFVMRRRFEAVPAADEGLDF